MQLTAGEALRALWVRWWVLLVAAIIAAAVAYGYTKLPWVEPRWKSSVWLQATGRFDYGNTLALEKQLRPLAEQVRQLNVMREVDRNLHLDVPAEKMLDNTKAEPVQDSSQIRIDVEDADPKRAQNVALEIADVYTQNHNAEQQAKLREEQVIMAVLDRPSTAILSWPQTRVLVPAAGLLGLLVAGLVVLLLAYFDDTLKSHQDVERYLALPIVGLIPREVASKPVERPRPAAAAASRSVPAGELTETSPTR